MAGHSRPPKLARRLFPSSDSSSGPPDEDTGPGGGGWRPHNREDSRGSEAGTAESWEFRSVQETPERQDTAAPIARLESLDELETSQVRHRPIRGQHWCHVTSFDQSEASICVL